MAKRKLIQLDIEKIKRKGELNYLVLDLFMVLVVVINLLFIFFDWHWHFGFIQRFFRNTFPDFFNFYNYRIHPDFLLYDIYFVIIYVSELAIRWLVAIRQKTYYRWFWYPFIHWYDVLGCVPLGTFHFLRLFRIVSITLRLQKLEIIDLRRTYLYNFVIKYYDIFIEEISDRVVMNIMSSWQRGIKDGGPVLDRIINEVLQPKKEVLVEWASHRLRMVGGHNYERRRDALKGNLERVVQQALNNNPEIQNLRKIPFVGKSVVEQLQGALSGVTFNVIDGFMAELASEDNKVVVEELADMIFDSILMEEKDKALDKITKDIVVESIEIMKADVAVQQWKVREEKRKQIRERAKAIKKAKGSGEGKNE